MTLCTKCGKEYPLVCKCKAEEALIEIEERLTKTEIDVRISSEGAVIATNKLLDAEDLLGKAEKALAGFEYLDSTKPKEVDLVEYANLVRTIYLAGKETLSAIRQFLGGKV